MAQARRKPAKEAIAAGDQVARIESLRTTIGDLSTAAVRFLPIAKVEATATQWLAGIPRNTDDFGAISRNALTMASALALFTPNLIGQTAIDRFARQHTAASPEEAAAIEAMRRSRFRLLSLEARLPPHGFRVRDIATGEILHLVDGEIPPANVSWSLAVRVCPIAAGPTESDIVVIVGPLVPLDDVMLDLARQWIRPNGRGLAAQRCSDVLYRHYVRYGLSEAQSPDVVQVGIPGAFPFAPEDGPLHRLAFALSRSGVNLTAAQVQRVREMAGVGDIVNVVIGISAARIFGREPLAAAYETLALIQMETVERRAATGLSASLDHAAAGLDRAIAEGAAPSSARDLFQELRRRVRIAPPSQKSANVDLDKVLGRIQALREKTVDRGCTEQEALLAAEKVAEMLDRYGLSLSEVELKNQPCEGAGIETGRKRFGPIDTCIPAVGRFCDCRVWSEKAAGGDIRYVFFGLPADVAGARYLYELVGQAFDTETERFKAGPLYVKHRSSDRRSATTSFQTGLAHGIAGKLNALHEEREVTLRTSTGRDLVLIKDAVVDDELAKLGMTFQTRSSQSGKRVLGDAYDAGREAGDRFECRAGIEQAGI